MSTPYRCEHRPMYELTGRPPHQRPHRKQHSRLLLQRKRNQFLRLFLFEREIIVNALFYQNVLKGLRQFSCKDTKKLQCASLNEAYILELRHNHAFILEAPVILYFLDFISAGQQKLSLLSLLSSRIKGKSIGATHAHSLYFCPYEVWTDGAAHIRSAISWRSSRSTAARRR